MSGGQIIRPSGARLILPSGARAIHDPNAGACCGGVAACTTLTHYPEAFNRPWPLHMEVADWEYCGVWHWYANSFGCTYFGEPAYRLAGVPFDDAYAATNAFTVPWFGNVPGTDYTGLLAGPNSAINNYGIPLLVYSPERIVINRDDGGSDVYTDKHFSRLTYLYDIRRKVHKCDPEQLGMGWATSCDTDCDNKYLYDDCDQVPTNWVIQYYEGEDPPAERDRWSPAGIQIDLILVWDAWPNPSALDAGYLKRSVASLWNHSDSSWHQADNTYIKEMRESRVFTHYSDSGFIPGTASGFGSFSWDRKIGSGKHGWQRDDMTKINWDSFYEGDYDRWGFLGYMGCLVALP